MKIGGKNKHKSKYVTDITGPGPLSLVELGGGAFWKIKKKMRYL